MSIEHFGNWEDSIQVVVVHVYPAVTGQRQNLTIGNPHTNHYIDYFVLGGIRTCFAICSNPKFLRISSDSRQLNLVLVRSRQGEVVVKTMASNPQPRCRLNVS